MLVLSRRLHESVMIGDDVQVTVVSIDRGVIRLGITAPRQVPVDRQEVYDLRRRQQSPAAPAESPRA